MSVSIVDGTATNKDQTFSSLFFLNFPYPLVEASMFEYIRSASRRTGAGGRSPEETEAFFKGRERMAAAVDAASADAVEDEEEAYAASFEPPPSITFAAVATRRSGRGACDWRVGGSREREGNISKTWFSSALLASNLPRRALSRKTNLHRPRGRSATPSRRWCCCRDRRRRRRVVRRRREPPHCVPSPLPRGMGPGYEGSRATRRAREG